MQVGDRQYRAVPGITRGVWSVELVLCIAKEEVRIVAETFTEMYAKTIANALNEAEGL
jgi:hypothetical protein